MEFLYVILSILFFSTIIIFMLLLFFRKPAKKSEERQSSPSAGMRISKVFGRDPVSEKNSGESEINSEYILHSGSLETVNETIRDIALDIVISNVRDNRVHVESWIFDDDALSRDGVVVGRDKGCDYYMNSLFLDRDGTFLIKRVDDTFMFIANRNSTNGIRSEFRGAKMKKIELHNGKSISIFVGPIRFDFSVPSSYKEKEKSASKSALFYSEETLNEGTREYSF